MVDVAEMRAICRAEFDAASQQRGALSPRIMTVMAVEERFGIRFTGREIDAAETPETIAGVALRKIDAKPGGHVTSAQEVVCVGPSRLEPVTRT